MKFYEENLPKNNFVRIHRSYIVKIEEINRIEPYTKDNYVAVLHSGDKLLARRSSMGLTHGTPGHLQLQPGENGQMQLDDVVADDEGGEHQDADEGSLVDVPLTCMEGRGRRAPSYEQQEDHAAVEDGERQQVDHSR